MAKSVKISEMIPREIFENEKKCIGVERKKMSVGSLISMVGEISESNEILKGSFVGVLANYFDYDEKFSFEELEKRVEKDLLPFATYVITSFYAIDEIGKKAIREINKKGGE
jgi:hypothetical protein